MSDPPGYHVAIVGFGPRGFGCLERLAVEVARDGSGRPPLLVTAHDPRPHPGAGPPYDPDQPACMLLNFSARHVDLWSGDNDLLPAHARPDFPEWLRRNHPAWDSGDAYVPRRLLGAYLRDAFASLRAALPATLRFRHVQGEVHDLELSDGRWSVRHDDPTLDVEGVDQVMVAMGHGTWSEDGVSESWIRELPEGPRTRRIAGVYPVVERLSREAVPDGAVVAVRGFALTALDAVLALTEGRGGTFEEVEGSRIPRYRGPTGGEVTLLPFSRTGLPPLAKPGTSLVQRSSELGELWEGLRRGILETDELTPGDLRRRLHQAEVRALAALCGRGVGLQPRGDGPAESGPRGPLGAMERSVLVASGVLPPDETWARGEAWRQAYPAVVIRAGEGGLAESEPAAFARLARTRERHAFGPPVSNLARLVALVRAGRVDLGLVRAPRIRAEQGRLVLQGEGATTPLDVLVNAVLPPPGAHEDTPLLLELVRREHATRAPGWNGVLISPSAASIGRDGQPIPGLSVVGRATEGWIVGNDTLNRTLHDHTRRWARRVLHERTATAPRAADRPTAVAAPS